MRAIVKRAWRFGSYKDWKAAADFRKWLALSHYKQRIINSLMKRELDFNYSEEVINYDKTVRGEPVTQSYLRSGGYRKLSRWQRSYYRFLLAGIWTWETETPSFKNLERVLEMDSEKSKR